VTEELLQSLDTILQAPECLIALDRDGTLVPYADRPELAAMPVDLTHLLTEIAEQAGMHVAVVSARSVAQLRGDFAQSNLILAGNYGLEILFPDGRSCVHPDAQKTVHTLKEIRDSLAARIDLNRGVILEDHGYTLCLHFQASDHPVREQLRQTVEKLEKEFAGVRFRKLPTSYEVLPAIGWDKGAALQFIDDKLPACEQARSYFYAGDTEADIPAFSWVEARHGVSVRVGGTNSLGAQFQLASTRHLHMILEYACQRRTYMPAA
jgi:trehalose-phosphatase